ncbi:MAG: 50S ribosomal protein L4 [candidate division WOR-3 bacterium]
MPKVLLTNQQGEQIGEIELKDPVFGIRPNSVVLHRKLVAELANARQGTHDTLTRGEVRGGGRKPWRQKHTGRARQGSIRAPHWRHGGIVHGPKPRSYRQHLNKKEKQLAIRAALSAKLAAGDLIAVQTLTLPEAKTKRAVEFLKNLGVHLKRVLFILPEYDETLLKAFRNLPNVIVRTAPSFSVHDLLGAEKVVATEQALRKMEEVWST